MVTTCSLHLLVLALLTLQLYIQTTVNGDITNNIVENIYNEEYEDQVHKLVRKWAPLVYLAPGERFLPSAVPDFLQHVTPTRPNGNGTVTASSLPAGKDSERYYLTTNLHIEELLKNKSSILYGQNPQQVNVPVYAVVTRCNSIYQINKNAIYNKRNNCFHVTYWFFYPFNKGKDVCTVTFGFLGPLPIPRMFNKCLGQKKYFGNHVGDWEHMSLFFRCSDTPEKMYLSTHDAGVYYGYANFMNSYFYERQEVRKGIRILQVPSFPIDVNMTGSHPILYSAKGSHGLWSRPGYHKYNAVPRLYDETGPGIPWKTWENIEIIDPIINNEPKWIRYRGRWGNTKSNCHPLKNVGINILCQLSEGPTGIPMKRLNFVCPKIKYIR